MPRILQRSIGLWWVREEMVKGYSLPSDKIRIPTYICPNTFLYSKSKWLWIQLASTTLQLELKSLKALFANVGYPKELQLQKLRH